MTQLQSAYNRRYGLGQPGQLARKNEPYFYDTAQASMELKPGDGVYRDSNGKWIKPASEATQKQVTHIVTYNYTSTNTTLAQAAGNALTGVTFAAGDMVDAFALGCVYVVAGDDVKAGDLAVFDYNTDDWAKYTPTVGTIGDFTAAVIEFLEPAADGDIVAVRSYGRHQR